MCILWRLHHAACTHTDVSMLCRALAFAPCDAGLLLVAGHEDGKVRITSCSEPGLGHEASSWPCLYSLAMNDAQPAEPSNKACIGVSWQPRPHAQQPFLAVATSTAVSVWCYDQCASHMHLHASTISFSCTEIGPRAAHCVPSSVYMCIEICSDLDSGARGESSKPCTRVRGAWFGLPISLHSPAGCLWIGYVCVRTWRRGLRYITGKLRYLE